ncbi:MAG TPA: DJ-1/PfpI family protein [Caulobacterales bacterium]|nr:DJ-1/PfpI family protein [Caulobacterales bacterium]
MAEPFKIVFILYPRLTQLDFTGPYEILSRLPGVEVIVASKEGGTLASETGLQFAGLTRLANISHADMICIPGGPGQTEAMQDMEFMSDVRRLGEGARYVTSVCTGSLILAAAGLLNGKRAACHWAYREMLGLFGAIPDAARVVRDGDAITGGGVTAGIDFGLTVAAELRGPAVAQTLQLMLEYAPAPPFDSGRPETAPPEILESAQERFAAFAKARAQAMQEIAARA